MRKITIIGIVLAFFIVGIGGAFADPRMSQVEGDKYGHFVRNPNNADDEIYNNDSNLSISINPDGPGGAYGVATVSIPLPFGDSYKHYTKGAGWIRVTSAQNNTPCTFIDYKGDVYKSNNWRTTIYHYRNYKTGNQSMLKMEVSCWNGEQQ